MVFHFEGHIPYDLSFHTLYDLGHDFLNFFLLESDFIQEKFIWH